MGTRRYDRGRDEGVVEEGERPKGPPGLGSGGGRTAVGLVLLRL